MSYSIRLLRSAILVPWLASGICMFVTHQKAHDWETRSRDWPALWFFAVANIIGAAYNLTIILLPKGSMLWRLVVVLDLYISSLVLASLSAAIGDIYLMMNGSPSLGHDKQSWVAICGNLYSFCFSSLFAVGMTSFGIIICFLLLTYTLHVLVNPLLIPNFYNSMTNPSLEDKRITATPATVTAP